MPPEKRDLGYLWDMLDAARSASDYTTDMRFIEYLNDKKTRHAVERSLEIIGEAARRVSSEVQEANPGIPWRSLVGLRNVLAHEYGDVRHEVLWNICKTKLQDLINQLVALGAEEPPKSRE